MANTFTAQYDGHCSDCGTDVDAGDEAGYWDDEFLCEDCFWQAVDFYGGDDWGMS